jgi:archaemetzincin
MPSDPAQGAVPAASHVRALVVRPVGPVRADLLADVTSRVSRAVSVPCRVGPPLEGPAAADVKGRDQWDADRLLSAVEDRSDEPGAVLVALAARDMGNVVFTHFFGRARLHGRALVVSLARLGPEFYGMAPDREVTARRAAVEVLHELGHVAGLAHCAEPLCLMRLARNVEAIDLRGAAFCGACAAAMPHGLILHGA